MSAPTNVLHLRAETKPLEHRSALTPSTTKALIEAGYTVNVERDAQRIFDDEEFERVGAKLVPTGSWVDAPKEHIIVGLKELEEKDCESPQPRHHYQNSILTCIKLSSSIPMCSCT
jgi:saccharopine dehydrogenase (NAD+, L-lysine-forming)